jgi:hypothetical protein
LPFLPWNMIRSRPPLELNMSHILIGWTPSVPGGNPNSECRNPKQIPIPNVPTPKHRSPGGCRVASDGWAPLGIGFGGLFRVWDLGFGISRASKRTKSTTDPRCPAAEHMGKDEPVGRGDGCGRPQVIWKASGVVGASSVTEGAVGAKALTDLTTIDRRCSLSRPPSRAALWRASRERAGARGIPPGSWPEGASKSWRSKPPMDLRFADGRWEMGDWRALDLALALDPDSPVFMATMCVQNWRSKLFIDPAIRDGWCLPSWAVLNSWG